MQIKEIIKKLTSVPGVSGFEGDVNDVFLSLIAPYADSVEKGRANNAFAMRKGRGKKLLIEAHSDRIGLMITKVTGGFLSFLPVGGIDPKILPGALVSVNGIPGVIGAKPPHLQTKDEDKSLKIADMLIDTGLSDASEKVRPGDVAVLDGAFLDMGGKIASGALDNRACLAALVRAAELIKNPAYDIIYAATGAEEVGMRGAAALPFSPDIAISLDVTFAKSHGSDFESFPLETPTVSVSPGLSRELSYKLLKIAEEEGIRVSTEVESGSSGTNAWAIASACPGARTALISVPVKYMHSVYEVCSVETVEKAARLVSAFAERGAL